MIVLQQNAVGQIVAVVATAADRNGIFFQKPHIRRRLARVEEFDPASFQQLDNPVRVRSHAAQALQVIKSYPFS